MRIISGVANSGKIGYVISEYIVPKIMNGGKVYYHGRTYTSEMIEDICECSGKDYKGIREKFIGLQKIESYAELDRTKTAMLVIDDYYITEEKKEYLAKLSKDTEIIIIVELSNGDDGIVLDNNKEVKYNKDKFEVILD